VLIRLHEFFNDPASSSLSLEDAYIFGEFAGREAKQIRAELQEKE